MDFDVVIEEYRLLAQTQVHIEYQQVLKPGVEHPSVSAVRERLRVLGDLVAEHDGNVYDEVMVESIKRFQSRNTLKVDGIAGPQTFSFLNAEYPDQLKALGMSKEKWDSIPKTTGKKIVVNIPGFECWMFDNEVFLFKTKCIVGRQDRKTVEFSDNIEYADFRPYWNVPDSIFRRDKMPKILRYGPKYLIDNHFQVISKSTGKIISPYSIDWRNYQGSIPPVRLRQTPGEWNALGLVKYMFPNKYNIYLHDTPDKDLFARDSRSLSSGCIRLLEPEKIGSFLLDKPVEEIINNMKNANNNNNIVRLENSVPIHITYMTAWIDENSQVRFAPDIYKKTPMVTDDYVLSGNTEIPVQLGQPLQLKIIN